MIAMGLFGTRCAHLSDVTGSIISTYLAKVDAPKDVEHMRMMHGAAAKRNDAQRVDSTGSVAIITVQGFASRLTQQFKRHILY